MTMQQQIDALAKKYGKSTSGLLVLEMALRKALGIEESGWLGAYIGCGYVSIQNTPRAEELHAQELARYPKTRKGE